MSTAVARSLAQDLIRFQVLDAGAPGDRAAWERLWSAAPGREVMAHPEYARLFARPCDRAVAVAAETEAGAFLMPLVLRPLGAEPWAAPGESRWDAATPYGYGGPFAWRVGPDEVAAYWDAFGDWSREARLVSTFLRLSVFTDRLATLPWPLDVRTYNVVVPLEGGLDAVWRGYDSEVRRWLRRAARSGLEVAVEEGPHGVDRFMPVYLHTMERREAESVLPRAFFTALAERLPGRCAFFHVLSRGEVVSTEVVLCSDDVVYSLMGGTLASAFPLGPNYALKHHVAEWAIARGARWYLLGGGRALRDSLLRYKRLFAPHGEVPFQVACAVHDPAAYGELAARRAAPAADGWAPRPDFFPAYRSPPAV